MRKIKSIIFIFLLSMIVSSCAVHMTNEPTTEYTTTVICPICHGERYTYHRQIVSYNPYVVYVKVVCSWCSGLGYTYRYYVPQRIRVHPVPAPRPRLVRPIPVPRPQPNTHHRHHHNHGGRR